MRNKESLAFDSFSKHNKLKTKIYSYLKKQIINGKYKPRDQLLIKDLSEYLNVSITPIREALKELENDGVLSKEPYKSYEIKSFSKNEIKEIFEARTAIESFSLKLSLRRNRNELITELLKVKKMGDKIIDKNDINSFNDYNENFHLIIVKMSHNDYLINQYKQLQLQNSLFTIKVFGVSRLLQRAHRDHCEIIKMLSSNDINQVLQKLEKHILNTYKLYIEMDKD